MLLLNYKIKPEQLLSEELRSSETWLSTSVIALLEMLLTRYQIEVPLNYTKLFK